MRVKLTFKFYICYGKMQVKQWLGQIKYWQSSAEVDLNLIMTTWASSSNLWVASVKRTTVSYFKENCPHWPYLYTWTVDFCPQQNFRASVRESLYLVNQRFEWHCEITSQHKICYSSSVPYNFKSKLLSFKSLWIIFLLWQHARPYSRSKRIL